MDAERRKELRAKATAAAKALLCGEMTHKTGKQVLELLDALDAAERHLAHAYACTGWAEGPERGQCVSCDEILDAMGR